MMNFCPMAPSGSMIFQHPGVHLAAIFYLTFDILPNNLRTIMSNLDMSTAKLIKVSS